MPSGVPTRVPSRALLSATIALGECKSPFPFRLGHPSTSHNNLSSCPNHTSLLPTVSLTWDHSTVFMLQCSRYLFTLLVHATCSRYLFTLLVHATCSRYLPPFLLLSSSFSLSFLSSLFPFSLLPFSLLLLPSLLSLSSSFSSSASLPLSCVVLVW
jgi:hypothetical protein